MRSVHRLRTSVAAVCARRATQPWTAAVATAPPSRCFAAFPTAIPSASFASTAAASSASAPASPPSSAAADVNDPSLSMFTLPELSPGVQTLLRGYSHPVPIPVAWSEQDMFGHVNNARYITWAETARIHWLRQLACAPIDGQKESDASSSSAPSALSAAVRSFMSGSGSAGPILKSNFIDYKLPVQYPDQIIVASRLGAVGEDRFALLHRLVSLRTGRVVAEAEGVIVCFDYDRQTKTSLPPLIRAAIEQRQGEQTRSEQTDGPPVKPPRKSTNFESY